MYREMEESRIPKRVLYMNLRTTRLRGRPRNRWQDEVREDVRIVGGEGWQEKVHNSEEWRKLLRTARNCRILHMSMEWNEWNCVISHTTVHSSSKYVIKVAPWNKVTCKITSHSFSTDTNIQIVFSFTTFLLAVLAGGIHTFIHSIAMCRMRQFLAILRSFLHSSLLCTSSCHPSPPTILPTSLT